MRVLWKILFLAALLIGVGLGTVWYYVTGTPHYSLYRLSEAIHAHDADGVERYIDIDRIADDATETIVNSVLAKQGQQDNLSRWEQFGQDVAKGAVRLMLPTVKAKFREDLRIGLTRMIEGEQQGDPILSPPSGAMEAYKAFEVSSDRKVAYVSYDDPKQGLIKFKMVQRSDRRWKIVSFDRDSVINWVHDTPVRNIKSGKITEIKVDKWLVEVGCIGYAAGSERCQPDPQYRWLKSLRDHHPKFIAYSKLWMPKDLELWTPKDLSKIDVKEILELRRALEKSGLIVYQVVDHLRPDIFLQYASAYVGPFGSEKDAKTWIEWGQSLGSLPDGYDFHPRRIIKYVGAFEPEEKLLSPPKKIEGVVTRVADERSGLSFWLKKDEGGEIAFTSEGALAYAPRNKDKGRRYLVEYRDIAYKRAGKVVSEDREVLELRDIDPRKREQDVCRIQLDVFRDEKKARDFMRSLGKEHYGAFLVSQEKDGQQNYLICIMRDLSPSGAQEVYGHLKLKDRFPRSTIVAGEEKGDKSNY